MTYHVNAQHNHKGVCGTTIADQELMDVMFTNEPSKIKTFKREDQIYVPVKFHMVANSNGESRILFSNVVKNLARINRDYKVHNITFYMYEGVNEIDNTSIFLTPTQFPNLIVSHKDPNAVNIFICQNADTGSSGGGTTLGYYQPGGDYIVVRKQELESASSTLSHELGHFFSLRHTFFGWEGQPWNQDTHGSTVTLTKAPGTNIDVEIVERSNCDVAADRFCDTPPDYNFGITNGGCSFTTVVNDRNGERIIPMADNFMSYFEGCSSYQFTGEQEAAIRSNFNSSARDFLKSTYEADTTRLEKLVLTNPASPGQKYDNYNAVSIEWEDYPEAKNVLLELIVGSDRRTYTTSDAGLFITDLEPNQTYQGFLVPYNDGLSDFNQTSVVFRTGDQTSSVDEINYFTNFRFTPNPLSRGNVLNLIWDSSESGELSLDLFDVSGKQVYQNNYSFYNGNNNITIPTEFLGSGMYIVKVSVENKILTKRIIID